MDRSGALAFHPSPSDAERERIRELSRYYCTFRRPSAPSTAVQCVEGTQSDNGSLQKDEQPTARDLSSDITLTALAQLGVHRLGCNRSFVSIIDGDNQHIIAEATASVSLRNKDRHLPNDGIYLGARTLDLVWGVCPQTIRLFTGQDMSCAIDTSNITANRTRYIIRDFTQEDCFKDRPYVREWPHMRFYAEVPLYSPSGYVLGSYCVVDDKPRTELGDDEVAILQEVADAVARHLENTRVVYYHRRAERLVKGLTNFAKHHSDFDPHEVSSHHRLEARSKSANAESLVSLEKVEGGEDGTGVSSSASTGFTELVTPGSIPGQASVPTAPSSINFNMSECLTNLGEERSLGDALRPEECETVKAASNPGSQVSLAETLSLSDRVATIFSRASGLLRDSMDLDGVMFLDAARSNPSFQPFDYQESWEPLPRIATPEIPIAPCPSPLGLPESTSKDYNVPCGVLSSAWKTSSADSSGSNRQIFVTEELLNALISQFPQGRIFTLDSSTDSDDYVSFKSANDDPENQSKRIQMISRQVMQLLPGARSVLFFPLWDYHKSRWMAGTLVWTRDSHRALGMEELHYFKVFGDSIVSEVSRAHWTATETSKFDFISSVSHELRSPLHGILASAELLQATPLQPAQKEIIRMIETSGLTLLDTTDHLLEFRKINSLSHAKKSQGNRYRSDASSLVSDFDLGQLVEEVTNIVYSGQAAPTLAGPDSKATWATSASREEDSDDMSVVVRIEQGHSWNIRSLPAAWRRIVMNLLGNALKWTKSGFIEISLSRARKQSEPQNFLAHLSVTDTGCGISSDFLRHKIFSPFSQEDPLIEGVGLGLSIVRQLATSLDGDVNVKSELGIGTQVDVFIPVRHTDSPCQLPVELPATATEGCNTSLHACLISFNGYEDLKETPTGMLTVEAKRKLSIQSTLADVFMSKFGWSISLAESLDRVRGDVAVLEEVTFRAATKGSLSPTRNFAAGHSFKFFVVLGSKSPSHDNFASNVIWVSQPFGPQKIQTAVQKILELREAQVQPDHTPTTNLSIRFEQPVPDPESSSTPIDDDEDTTPKPSIETTCPVSPQTVLPIHHPIETKARHVLIVDDNEINLKIMATFMRRIGCSYDTASNGLIALEKYMTSSQQYDFVLMDISMPVMDGLVSTSKIRQYEREKGLQPSCIMAVTGVASDSMQQQALTAGVDDYLIKPLSLRELGKLMSVE